MASPPVRDVLEGRLVLRQVAPHVMRYQDIFPAILRGLRDVTGHTFDRYADWAAWWREHGENFEIPDEQGK